MRIDNEVKLDFKDVLIRPKRSTLSSRNQVDITRDFKFKYGSSHYVGVPIIAANMDGVGTFSMVRKFDELNTGMSVALRKHYEIDSIIKFENKNSWITIGSSDNDFDKILKIKAQRDVPYICFDVANGYSESFVDRLKLLREYFPESVIMAGNVVTSDMVEALILAGADIVKVGIGPGAVCTTRKMTGVGYPQLSAIIECADAAHGLGAHVCADGGCQVPGDIAKAFGAGADFVMLGSMLAGHEEGEYNEIKNDPISNKKTVLFYGMSSDTAQLAHEGTLRKYRASEGKTVEVEFKGSVENTIQEILGGLRSACTYVGARKLKELSKRTTFVRVSQQLNPMFS